MPRILAVADEVVPNLEVLALADGLPDLVLSAGDLPADYLEHVAEPTGAPLLYVPGNHENHRGPRGGTCVDGEVLLAGGVRVAGLGGCVRYRPGPHQYSQRQYHQRAARLVRAARSVGPVDVLLTHAPPLGCGDDADAAHQGIEALHDVLAALEPTWHLHGHVHPYGRPKPDRQVGRTTVCNVIPWRMLQLSR